MKINDCENCGSNELTFSVWNKGGVEYKKIECECCKLSTGELTNRTNDEIIDIWNTNNMPEAYGDERMLPCLVCGSKKVSADLQLAKAFIGKFTEFGCADCDNHFLTDIEHSEDEIIAQWNADNKTENEHEEDACDEVNHPSHYQSESGVECIDAIVAALGIEGAIAYCRGNVIKYSWRTDKKNGAQDLRKAEWYSRKAAELMGEKE